MTIHKEGTGTILVTVVFLVALNSAVFHFFPDNDLIRKITVIFSVLFSIIILQFFRVPKRVTVKNPKKIIAPADGKVVVIEAVEEPEYFKGRRRQISIFMSPVNVHINFNPLSGIVSFFKYHPGKFLVAWHPKASTENERTTIVVRHENGTEVMFRQIAGALARRICWYVEEGKQVEQGSEFGFIKFGSRVDIFLPLDAKILVNLDDRPVGGETVIAELA
ncbi:phosphatidylserine decarboxylase family protein [Flectobacillus sp. DC10W]|jgi:phosphatidylserine decarboxylase|uniref:Phosphatidylserine decarboxylase proenzyme n=1 Tax=Flectobacillus longus TaxID=2984207 RepID=A0ABT6YP86_9BACT|nr:phosphatidylserine decarboxylase family protein [Flectobacillus longus]MDI9865351.1 phosphatidylserine decarboxylase family protein [Flectobacillus longus]